MATDISLVEPTAAEAAAYAACVAFDRQRFLERAAGRAGYLSQPDEDRHSLALATVNAALARGVGFDRQAVSQ